METLARSFPLKNGHCHLFPDRLEIEGHGFADQLNRSLYGMGFRRALFVNLLLVLLLGIALGIALWIENYTLALFFGVAILYYLWASWVKRDISIASVIPREQIQSVTFQEAVPGASRAHFMLYFSPKPGQNLRQVLLMPIEKSGGGMVIQSAYLIMKEEGLIKP